MAPSERHEHVRSFWVGRQICQINLFRAAGRHSVKPFGHTTRMAPVLGSGCSVNLDWIICLAYGFGDTLYRADTGSDLCAWDFCSCVEFDYIPRSLLRLHGHDASHLEGIERLLSLCNTNSYHATAQLKTTFFEPIFEFVFPAISKCNAHRGRGGMDWHLGTRSCITGSSGCKTDISLLCRV
jgi:hypothetical protein